MKSDVGQHYFDGLVIFDELVPTLLYAGTPKEREALIRVTVVRPDGWEGQRETRE